ncbi:MAG: transposase, partial [Armatimonadota bacterium]
PADLLPGEVGGARRTRETAAVSATPPDSFIQEHRVQKPEFVSLFRPHRQPREMYRGVGTVFFTAAINDRKKAFACDDLVLPRVSALTKCFRKALCRCDAYCFMPDHLHVLATGMTESSDAWFGMVTFKQQTGRLLREQDFAWQVSFIRAGDGAGSLH